MTSVSFAYPITESWDYPKISKSSSVFDEHFLKFLDSESSIGEMRIYLHIPFCKSFCYFCQYYKGSHVIRTSTL
jgi:oxygen-independent coproporphyrinogen-3 oxidase